MEKKQLPEMPVKWLRNLKWEGEKKNKGIWIEKQAKQFLFFNNEEYYDFEVLVMWWLSV